jgi:predicted phage-related endonuclease
LLQLPLLEEVSPAGKGISCGDLDFPYPPNISNVTHMDSAKTAAVQLSLEDARKLEANTREQANSPLWTKERSKRITASNFGRFMLRKTPLTKKFVDSVLKTKSFTSSATSYGSANEKVAINMYRKKTCNHVHGCGFVVNPKFPFLGASPDGKVCDPFATGILEVKCPFIMRDRTIKEALADEVMKKKICIEQIQDKVQMKRDHMYWYQVQGQLLVTGAKFCEFVLFTRQDLFIERIEPDQNTMEQIFTKMVNVFEGFVCEK